MVGQIFQSVFGFAVEGDTELLQREIHALANTQSTLLNETRKAVADMARFANIESHRMTNLISQLTSHTVEQLRLSENRQSSAENAMHYKMEIIQHTLGLLRASELLDEHLASFLIAAQQLRDGKVSPFLLSPEILSEAIANITTIL